ncbi:50S ribosomal protein L18 [Candidatus Woesearchaeota archaeon]|nr:50S ribosomal protein L18 [Candidatus Woesearchaeota archaeon]
MLRNNIFTVPFRRKREGRTYYKRRIRLLQTSRHRFVVRKSLRNLRASIVEYFPTGDKVIITANSQMLGKFGWKGGSGNMASAYLAGFAAGKKALEKGIKSAILDIGFNKSTKGSRIYAAIAGAIDAGLKIPVNAEILPPKERIEGAHIAKYASMLKEDRQKYERQFSAYLKNGFNPEDIIKHFNEVKVRING